jgi:hypothetical protein
MCDASAEVHANPIWSIVFPQTDLKDEKGYLAALVVGRWCIEIRTMFRGRKFLARKRHVSVCFRTKPVTWQSRRSPFAVYIGFFNLVSIITLHFYIFI